MTVHEYPRFRKGQTLTADELNQLLDHVRNRDRMVALMAGFGVNCGLTGTFSGSELTVSSGLAVDQRGEPLVLAEARTLDLADGDPLPAGDYDYVDGSFAGWSIVLRHSDHHEPPEPCTETDCQGHSEQHADTLLLELVSGRVAGPRFAFPEDPFLQNQPILLSKTSQPLSAFGALRTAVSTRLKNGGSPIVDTALIALLDGVSVPNSDLPAVKAYKVAWLNMVLFAAFDLLRCRALAATSCLRDATPPGVVLGHVTKAGATYTFDCAYRHAWEPPRGLAMALLGGTCDEPCRVARDLVESIISAYHPPTPPPSGGGGSGPGVGGIKWKDWDDLVFVVPQDKLKYWPPDKYVEVPEFVKPIPEPDPYPWLLDDLVKVYENEPLELLGNQALEMGDLVGYPTDTVTQALTDAITETGVTPDILVVTSGELTSPDLTTETGKKLLGYESTLTFGTGDRVVLTAGTDGRVVGVGRVSAARAARDVGTAVPAAMGAAAQVETMALEVEQKFSGFNASIQEFGGSLATLKSDFATFSGGGFDLSGYGTRIGTLERQLQKVDAYGERLATLEGRVVSGPAGGGKAVSPDFAGALAEFTQSAVEAMQTIRDPQNPNLGRYITAAQRAQGELEVAAAAEDPEAVGKATIELLDTMRTMVKSADIDTGLGSRLDRQFREVRGLMG